jgi:hypothetical protein
MTRQKRRLWRYLLRAVLLLIALVVVFAVITGFSCQIWPHLQLGNTYCYHGHLYQS